MTHTLKIIREGNYLFTEDMAYHLPLNNARKIPNIPLLPPLLKDNILVEVLTKLESVINLKRNSTSYDVLTSCDVLTECVQTIKTHIDENTIIPSSVMFNFSLQSEELTNPSYLYE